MELGTACKGETSRMGNVSIERTLEEKNCLWVEENCVFTEKKYIYIHSHREQDEKVM
jgi:hypothetical protein